MSFLHFEMIAWIFSVMVYKEGRCNGENVYRKLHEHSYSAGWDIAIFLIFFDFFFFDDPRGVPNKINTNFR